MEFTSNWRYNFVDAATVCLFSFDLPNLWELYYESSKRLNAENVRWLRITSWWSTYSSGEGTVSLRALVITDFWIRPTWVWSGLLYHAFEGETSNFSIKRSTLMGLKSPSLTRFPPVFRVRSCSFLRRDGWTRESSIVSVTFIQNLIYASLGNAGNGKCHQTPNTCCVLPLKFAKTKLQQHVCRRTSFRKRARAHFPNSGW